MPATKTRCWGECLESGRYQGRAEITIEGRVYRLECTETRDTAEHAEIDAVHLVEQRLLGRPLND